MSQVDEVAEVEARDRWVAAVREQFNPRTVEWICVECAHKAGAYVVLGHLASFHQGQCEVCKQVKPVTEPRDFRWGNREIPR